MKQIRIEIPQYIRKVKISNKIREQYYIWNGVNFFNKTKKASQLALKRSQVVGVNTKTKKVVVKYNSVNEFLSKQRLNNIEYRLMYDNQYVLANPKKANTPREVIISGQSIYSGQTREFTRGKVFQAIKESFILYVKDIPIIDFYPVKIQLEIHDSVKNVFDKSNDEYGVKWDVGNRAYPYGKAFVDLLVTGKTGKRTKDDNPITYFTPKLPDDNRLFVTESPEGGIFVPLQDNDNTKRKLVFIITQDTRPEIVNNSFYIKFLNTFKDETTQSSETPY